MKDIRRWQEVQYDGKIVGVFDQDRLGAGGRDLFSADNVDTLFLPAFIKVQEFGVEEAVGIVDFVTVTDTVET